MKGENCVLIEGGVNRVWLYIFFPFLSPRVTDVPRIFSRVGWVFLGIFAEFLPTLGVALVHDTRRQSYLLTFR